MSGQHGVTQFFTKKDLAARYRVCTKSIDRWVGKKKYPPPDLQTPGGKDRWSNRVVEEHERDRVVETGEIAA